MSLPHKLTVFALALMLIVPMHVMAQGFTIDKRLTNSIVKIDVWLTPADFNDPEYDFYNEQEKQEMLTEPVQFGTGFIVDFSGCAFTAAHVLLREPATTEAFNRYTMSISSDWAFAPDISYEAEIAYLDVSHDVAILCPINGGDMFFHPLTVADSDDVAKLTFGDEIASLGYPQMGGESILFSKGYIMGFWDNPDLMTFLGIEFAEDMSLLKIDANSGPGGSGSPVFTPEGDVLGIMFAGSLNPSGAMFAISAKTIEEGIFAHQEELRIDGTIPPDCVYDETLNNFGRDGRRFYDITCSTEVDPNTEFLVRANYEARCTDPLADDVLQEATYTILTTEATTDGWWEYLLERCPVN